MKKLITIALFFIVSSYGISTQKVLSQDAFYITPIIQANNLWTWSLLFIPNSIFAEINGSSFLEQDNDVIKIKNNGDKIEIKNGNQFGFKWADLLDDLNFGIKVGWQSKTLSTGVYLKSQYRFNMFSMKYPDPENYTKNTIQTLITGIGIHFAPPIEEGLSCYPVGDVGINYEYNFAYKGCFNNNINQLNNGLTYAFAIGLGYHNSFETFLVFDLQRYDIFNKNFTPDNGITYPYKQITSLRYHISWAITMRI
jgi:hypothetical protein